ncbi:hypothetical protein [Nocardia amamiensis]|uniref:hypothetical protein n=1 Tax=Nocardia amamiensis TaxID=404578 RepID=UPI0008313E1A|nr:hypothetical protein [Nocardia amamiensis]
MKRSITIAAVVIGIALTVGGLTGCGSDHDHASDKAAPVNVSAPPNGTRWESYRGVFVPFTAAGPKSRSGAVPTGYEPTPQGAVAAAMQGQARLALAPDGGPESWSAAAHELVVPGPGRDNYAVQRLMASVVAEADPAQTAQFAGFRVEHWSTQATTVWLATRMPDGNLSAQPTKMAWRGGDWKIELPAPQQAGADGRVATDPVVLPNLDGYTEFHH